MDSNLMELVNRAESMYNELQSESRQPHVEHATPFTLDEVLQKTGELHARLKATEIYNSTHKATQLLAPSGVDLNTLTCLVGKLKIPESAGPNNQLSDPDVEGWAVNEVQNEIMNLLDETRNNVFYTVEKCKWQSIFTSWDKEKQQLLNILDETEENLDRQLPAREFVSTVVATAAEASDEPIDSVQQCYTQKLLSYNQSPQMCEIKLLYRFVLLAEHKFNDSCVRQMWNVVNFMAQVTPPIASKEPIKEGRMTPQFVVHARSYLEKEYRKYMNNVIRHDRHQASLGGASNLYNIISSFVRINFQLCQSNQNLLCGSLLWPHVYYSLRCGSISTAVQYLKSSPYANSNLMKFMHLKATTDCKLEIARLQTTLRKEYLENVRSCGDSYKKAVFDLMLESAPEEYHPEVIRTIDDILFVHFSKSSPIEQISAVKIKAELQKKFDQKSISELEARLLYFQSLVLVGYFELAIQLLAQNDAHWQHAVHMAIALNELSILAIPSNELQPLLSSDVADQLSLCRLNVVQLIKTYAQLVQETSIWIAFNYLYLLRDFKDVSGNNLMIKCMADLLIDHRGEKMLQEIFGRPDPCNPWCYNGGFFAQLPGITYGKVELAALMATELEICAKYEPAIEMYLIAQNVEKALSLLFIVLSPLVHMPVRENSLRERLKKLTDRLSPGLTRKKCDLSLTYIAYYTLLTQLVDFYDNYNTDKCRLASEVLDQTQLIPNDSDQVALCLNRIKFLGSNVTKVLPKLILAAMDLIYKQYLTINAARINNSCKEIQMLSLNKRSKALISLAATMPCRLTPDANKQLFHMEVLMQFK